MRSIDRLENLADTGLLSLCHPILSQDVNFSKWYQQLGEDITSCSRALLPVSTLQFQEFLYWSVQWNPPQHFLELEEISHIMTHRNCLGWWDFPPVLNSIGSINCQEERQGVGSDMSGVPNMLSDSNSCSAASTVQGIPVYDLQVSLDILIHT